MSPNMAQGAAMAIEDALVWLSAFPNSPASQAANELGDIRIVAFSGDNAGDVQKCCVFL